MTPLKTCAWFLESLLEILLIYYLNPIYILISDCIYYGCLQVFQLISQFDETMLLRIIMNVFSLLFYLIYVEIIELKFCGLDKNLKISITKRGIREIQGNDDDESDESHDEEEENDDNNEDNENNNDNDNNNVELKWKEWLFYTMKKKLKIILIKIVLKKYKIIYIYLEKNIEKNN